MAKAVSLVDTLRWTEDGVIKTFEGPVGANGVAESAKGLEVELPSDEFDRLLKAGAVAKPKSKAAKDAADDDTPEA